MRRDCEAAAMRDRVRSHFTDADMLYGYEPILERTRRLDLQSDVDYTPPYRTLGMSSAS